MGEQKIHLPQTRKEMWAFVYAHFGIRLSYRPFTSGHSTPLDFLCDAFFNPSKDVAAWASRSGGKTLTASILAALEYMRYTGLEGRVLSGSENQAKFLYRYWINWCDGVLAPYLDASVGGLKTEIAGGSFEILSASQKQVRGGKVQRLFEDELDEMEGEIDAAAVGMLASHDGIPARTVYTSTWHRADGLMGKLVENAPEKDVSLHKWNIFESIERCSPYRHRNGKGCRDCAIGDECVAKAREYHDDPSLETGIAAQAGGLYRIDDAVKAYKKVSRGMWDSEFLCRRPSVAGLVYPEFDADTHCRKSLPDNLKVYRSIDWGRGVFVCLWIGEDREGKIYILDTYRSEHGTLVQHARYIKSHHITDVSRTYCDPAGRNRSEQTGRSNIELFGEYGIECECTTASRLRNVQAGIAMVRSYLAPADGKIKLFYTDNENNRTFVKAMQNYSNRRVNEIWLDEPQDPQEFEHIPDALRYFVVNRRKSDAVAVVGYRAV